MNEKVTESDVARFLEGETSPEESQRVLRAISEDPVLAALAEILASDDEFEDHSDPDPELQEFIRQDANRLKDSRLWAIEPANPEMPLSRLAAGDVVPAVMHGRVGAKAQRIPLTFRQSATPNRFLMECEWPQGVDPIGLLLGEFDFQSRRNPWNGRVAIPTDIRHQGEGGVESRTSQSFALSASTPDQPQQIDSASFSVEGTRNLIVEGYLPENAFEDVVLMELQYDSLSDAEPVRHPVHLIAKDEGSDLGRAEVTEFPWPTDAAAAKDYPLIVRPLKPNDVSILSAEHVSVVLCHSPFEPFPLRVCEAAYDFGVRFNDQRSAIADAANRWFVRVAITGKGVG